MKGAFVGFQGEAHPAACDRRKPFEVAKKKTEEASREYLVSLLAPQEQMCERLK